MLFSRFYTNSPYECTERDFMIAQRRVYGLFESWCWHVWVSPNLFVLLFAQVIILSLTTEKRRQESYFATQIGNVCKNREAFTVKNIINEFEEDKYVKVFSSQLLQYYLKIYCVIMQSLKARKYYVLNVLLYFGMLWHILRFTACKERFNSELAIPKFCAKQ